MREQCVPGSLSSPTQEPGNEANNNHAYMWCCRVTESVLHVICVLWSVGHDPCKACTTAYNYCGYVLAYTCGVILPI